MNRSMNRLRHEIRWFLRSIVLMLFVSLAGCPAGPTLIVQQYSGPVRARETIATLRVNGKESVRLATLDDEEMIAPIASDSRLHVELLPGRHTLSVRDPTARERVSFMAAAYKVYRVVIEPGKEPGTMSVHVHEVDRDSDALGADVTESHP